MHVATAQTTRLYRLPPVTNAVTVPPHTDSMVRQVSGEADASIIPLLQTAPIDGVELRGELDGVTLVATEASLPRVLQMIANHHELNLVLGPDVQGPVTVSIRNAAMEEVLDAILNVSGFRWHRSGNLLYVTSSVNAGDLNREVQGRMLRVFPLNFVAADDVQQVATGLLSSSGKAFVTQSDSIDTRRTSELLVVEDIGEAIERIAEYIVQVDQPPRQVLIEAHVLQIALSDEEKHGINLNSVARAGGADLTLATTGFADEAASQGLAFRVKGTDLSGLLELIRTQTNSRTLASPKLTVVNHQEAKIQIGQRLSYNVSTTTQTATIQSVQFLDVGIVLTVLPIIADDGQILMTVLPKVSGGRINVTSGLPEEETTEVSTTVLLPDGGGMVIGGLIKDETGNNLSVVPGLSRIPVIGRLFQRRGDLSRRNEIVVALVAHVVPNVCSMRPHEIRELHTTIPDYTAESLREPSMIESAF